jgi:hypothetical protein
VLTINVVVLLAVIVFFLLRRRTESRSRVDEVFTAVVVLALGVLLAPTPLGHTILNLVGQVASSISHSAPRF